MRFGEWSEGCRVSVLVVSEREMVRLWVFLEGLVSVFVSQKSPPGVGLDEMKVFMGFLRRLWGCQWSSKSVASGVKVVVSEGSKVSALGGKGCCHFCGLWVKLWGGH